MNRSSLDALIKSSVISHLWRIRLLAGFPSTSDREPVFDPDTAVGALRWLRRPGGVNGQTTTERPPEYREWPQDASWGSDDFSREGGWPSDRHRHLLMRFRSLPLASLDDLFAQ